MPPQNIILALPRAEIRLPGAGSQPQLIDLERDPENVLVRSLLGERPFKFN